MDSTDGEDVRPSRSALDLLPHQKIGVDWLLSRPHSYLADDPGLGKTRQALVATKGRVLVVTPATVRDTHVWQDEARDIGWDGELTVVSYHGLNRHAAKAGPYDAVVFDEAHRLKERKVSWRKGAQAVAARANRVHLLSGTPVPNQASELWGQLSLIRDLGAYWPWAKRWFVVEANQFSAFNVTDRLQACNDQCRDDCVHWDDFHHETYGDQWLRRERDDVLTDLPPLTGQDHAMQTPMTPDQARAYRDMKETFLARLPDGATLEAVSHSQQFVRLWQMATGISSANPDIDPKDQQSGKMRLVEETLDGRTSPTLVVCWFRNTAEALIRTVQRLGVSVAGVSGQTRPKDRAERFGAFQRGELPVLVTSVGVVREGLTLTAADEVLLVERSWVPSDNEQVIRRLHRIGQTRPVTVRQLITPKTVDHGQWNSLHHKRAHIDKVLVKSIIDPTDELA